MPQKKQIDISINGFGRIGRAAFKIALLNPHLRPDSYRDSGGQAKLKVAAINDLTDTKTLAHLLKYDSVYGKYDREIKSDNKNLYVDGVKYPVFAMQEPERLPWKKLGIDVVLECTGRFVKDGVAKAHLKAGAKKVIISAPAKGKPDVPTYLIGVNEDKYKGENLIAMGSCTTNSAGAITKVIDENFKIKQSFLSTVHSYTTDQNLADGPHYDLRRARAAAHNIIPTTTGATIAVSQAYPIVKGKFYGLALRVPTICGCISDLTYLVHIKTTTADVNSVLKKAACSKQLKNVLAVSNEPLVSSDIIGTEYSAIIDSDYTQVLGENLIKIFAWYDNEWAYSKRLVEMAEIISK